MITKIEIDFVNEAVAVQLRAFQLGNYVKDVNEYKDILHFSKYLVVF